MVPVTNSRRGYKHAHSLRLERRVAARTNSSDVLPIIMRDDESGGLLLASLHLIDQSATGFGAHVDREIPVGRTITLRARGGVGVCIPAQAVRCESLGHDQGYFVGLRLCSTTHAAA